MSVQNQMFVTMYHKARFLKKWPSQSTSTTSVSVASLMVNNSSMVKTQMQKSGWLES